MKTDQTVNRFDRNDQYPTLWYIFEMLKVQGSNYLF